MQFLFPAFLWALLALSIPIIIHLFYFRRFKKVYFTNVKYLKEIKEETSNRNKLKNLLILISRCLAVACLVFAFAQPFIPKGTGIKSGLNYVSVFIDNSFSMTTNKSEIPLIDIAKDKARSVVSSYGDEDRFHILTHDFEGKHQRLLSKEDALTYIEDVQITSSVQDLDLVLNRQRQLLERSSGNRLSYILSDFQKSIVNLQEYRDTTMEINMVPVQSTTQKNVTIDSAWFEGPIPFLNQTNKLLVKVKNNSPEDIEQVKISFLKDGQEKPVAIRDIAANSTVTDTVNLTIDKSGWHTGILQVSDYPVQFDDKYYISFNVADTIKALFINDAGPDRFMNALFNGIKNFTLSNQSSNQLQYQQFQNFDMIMLHDLKAISSGLGNQLLQYMRDGGKVLIFPGKSVDIGSYNDFLTTIGASRLGNQTNLKREVSIINTEEFVFSDVYINTGRNLKLPVSTLSYNFLTLSSTAEEKLLTYRDAGSYLSKFRVGDGQLFLCASPLNTESNDLVYNAEVFVPLIYKMAISTTKQKPISYIISNNMSVIVPNQRKTGDYVYKLKDDKNEIIPGQTPVGNQIHLSMGGQIKNDGIFDLLLDSETVGKIALNYDRKESDMSHLSESELEDLNTQNPSIKLISDTQQANLSGSITEKDKGVVLWKWFVILALLFLAAETLLIRLLKN